MIALTATPYYRPLFLLNRLLWITKRPTARRLGDQGKAERIKESVSEEQTVPEVEGKARLPIRCRQYDLMDEVDPQLETDNMVGDGRAT